MRIIAAGALLLGQLAAQALGGGSGAGPGGLSAWIWPLSGPDGGPPAVVRPFQPPAHRWDAGHRGLDLEITPTAPDLVRAAAAGRVTFAGTLFGRGVITISHGPDPTGSGALRTSYEPVTPVVKVGDQVTRGQVIGELQPGHCADRPCLHWGLLTGGGRRIRYYDPSILVGLGQVRLEPVRSR